MTQAPEPVSQRRPTVSLRDGAIYAYERYLMLRRNPDAALLPQRDSVIAELAALKR